MLGLVLAMVFFVWLLAVVVAWRAHAKSVHRRPSALFFLSRYGLWATILINPLFAIVPVEVG